MILHQPPWRIPAEIVASLPDIVFEPDAVDSQNPAHLLMKLGLIYELSVCYTRNHESSIFKDFLSLRFRNWFVNLRFRVYDLGLWFQGLEL